MASLGSKIESEENKTDQNDSHSKRIKQIIIAKNSHESSSKKSSNRAGNTADGNNASHHITHRSETKVLQSGSNDEEAPNEYEAE